MLASVISVALLVGVISSHAFPSSDSEAKGSSHFRTGCNLEWRLKYDCCDDNHAARGNKWSLARAVNEGKEIKVVLRIGYATKYPGKVDHIRMENGEVVAFIANYLSDNFKPLSVQSTSFRDWITISTNGSMSIKRYDIIRNQVSYVHEKVRGKWYADESCGNLEAYRPDKRKKRSIAVPEEELSGPVSVVAVQGNVTFSFILDGAKIDYYKMYGQIKHKMRQILFPMGSFLHDNPFKTIKWFQKGCWKRLNSVKLKGNVYESMLNGSIPHIGNEVRMLFRGHKKHQSTGFSAVRYQSQNLLLGNTVFHYMLGTWKKYADHTKWECQSVTAKGQKRKTKFLSLAEWFVSDTANLKGSCTWMVDDLPWKMILQQDHKGNTVKGSHSLLWKAVENGASIRIVLNQGEDYGTYEVNEIALDLRREATVAKIVQCGKDINAIPGFMEKWNDVDKQLAIMTVQSKGPTRLSLWNVGSHIKGNHTNLLVQRFWFIRS